MNIHELRKKIKEYADAYYNEDAPLVTDEEYDALMHELRRLEAENPEAVAPDSPTQVVGGKRVLGIPVEHKVPMLSLLDVFSDKEVKDFLNDVWASFPDAAFSVERKIDGLSLSLVIPATARPALCANLTPCLPPNAICRLSFSMCRIQMLMSVIPWT